MSNQAHQLYEFGPFQLDTNERILLRENRLVPLTPKVFDTLLVLVENNGHILEKDELMKSLWPDSFVEESSLAQNIFLLRKALGEGNAEQRFIETIPKRGYRFVAPVRAVWSDRTEIILEERSSTSIVIEEEEPNNFSGTTTGDLNETSTDLKITEPVANGLTVMPAAPAAEMSSLYAQAKLNRIGLKSRLSVKTWLPVALSLALALAAWLAWRNLSLRPAALRPIVPFTQVRLTKLTNNGTSTQPALSPDGKYVAHVMVEEGLRSIWVRQVATNSSVRIVPPAAVRFFGLLFSPDGNYVYYLKREMTSNRSELFQIPALGGTPRLIIEDIDSPITFSPDGRRLAFVRGYPAELETSVIVAHSDGSNEQRLATRKRPEIYSFEGIAWSPTADLIAVPASFQEQDKSYLTVVGVRLDGRGEKPLTTERWNSAGRLCWVSDGSGLILNGGHRDSNIYADQIWFLPYPAGPAQRITNDLNGYYGVSLSENSRALVTGQTTRVSFLWLAPQGEAARARQITSGFGDHQSEWLGLTWTPDQKILYGSSAAGNPDIWLMNPDGSERKQLTTDPHIDVRPAATPDGRYIVFLSNRTDVNSVWRMDADGRNQKQLTTGLPAESPTLTPDGQWVVYTAEAAGKATLWKVPIDGGSPIQITQQMSARPLVSPDGQWIFCYYWDPPAQRMNMAVIPFASDGPPRFLRRMAHPDRALFQWSQDSSGIIYSEVRNGVSNLWRHPIDDGPPEQLTDYKSEVIFRFAWSPDYKQLVCERGIVINDLVLISDLR